MAPRKSSTKSSTKGSTHSSSKGSIHIKASNAGKFTKSAKAAHQSVQAHARAVMNNPKATTLQKRRANFAINAAKWKKK